MNATRPQLAVGAIVVHDGALLLVRRRRPPAAGKWSVPGGRVERGEQLRDAVAREVHEETGLVVKVGELAGRVERIDDEHHFVILDFFASVKGATAVAAGDDAADARWVPLADVASFDLVDGLLGFLTGIGSLGA